MSAVERSHSRSPLVAGVLSGLMPGLGQLYCREWMKGVGFLIGALVADVALGASEGFFHLLQQLLAGSPPQDAGSILLRSLPLLAIAAWSVMDAVRSAQKSH